MADNCCPPGSWPLLLQDANYTPAGEVSTIATDLPLYVAKPDGETVGAVIVLPEVFGFEGRLKQICDTLASKGYFVAMPDCHRGDSAKGKPSVPDWVKDCEEKYPVVEDLKQVIACIQSATTPDIKISAIGHCWGAWAWAKAGEAGLPLVCGISPHPSIKLEEFAFKKSQEELCEKVKFPTLLMAAGNDPDNIKPGGSLVEIFAKNCPGSEAVPFPDMLHGWFSRGDLAQPNVQRDVEKTMQLVCDFLAKYHA
ncbi:unnamed protein product [Amoebophrya sp. A120]|nr:unnamed protein product [Amoebophrya sp. A120]|eukprot:GSA120T00000097001.1